MRALTSELNQFTDTPSDFAVRVRLMIAYFLLAGLPIIAPRASAAESATVEQAVIGYFESLPNYQAGDLITRRDVEHVLKLLSDVGWDVPDGDAIAARALPDDSFLARELATPAGRKFMRKIASQPGGYSRLDRLSSIGRGQKLARDLIHQKGGDEFVAYLSITKGGKNLGRMLAGAKQGADLNKPTGRIYTADDLIAELARIYPVTAR